MTTHLPSSNAPSGCPFITPAALSDHDLAPELDVHREALEQALGWIRDFLCRPHPRLGRAGLVCPFTQTALELGTLWLSVCTATDPIAALDAMEDVYRRFVDRPAADPQARFHHVVLVVFPGLKTGAGPFLEALAGGLRESVGPRGQAIAACYPGHTYPGLRDPTFHPFRSTVPILAMRYKVPREPDWPPVPTIEPFRRSTP